jgi:serine/threonine protein kinase
MHESVRMAHMDIKPSNMLCRPTTQAGFVCVLCDFGGCMDADTPSSECTGTIGYMAPEVERLEGNSAGTEKYVPRYTDAFSLGAAFLHMLHPDVPYDTEQAQRLMLGELRKKGQSEAQKPEGQLFLALITQTTPPPQRYAQFQALAQSMMQPIGMYATSLPTMA